jgi:hypothetical protein
MRIVGFGVILLALLHACAPSHRTSGSTEGAAADWMPLAVEHDVSSPVRLRPGDTLRLRPVLRNTSQAPIEIRHGSRLFVLDAIWRRSADALERRPGSITFPPHQSWGEVLRWEYPNPGSVYTAELSIKRLEPGERYTPSLVYRRTAYHVPFDSTGTYALRLCADINAVRICGRRDLSVVVQ